MADNLLSRFLGRDKWPSAQATVYSVDYVSGDRYQPNGSWNVVYTYWVKGEIYTGRYNEVAQSSTETYFLKPEDTLDISYNPLHPEKNFNRNLDSISLYGFLPWIIVAGFAFVVILVVFLRR